MKLIFFSAILILSFFVGFMILDKKNNFYPSKAQQLVENILDQTAQTIKYKYKIQPSGEGIAMPGGPIRELALYFDTKDQLTKEQLRKLLVKCSLELVDQINANSEIQQFLKAKPFTLEKVQIIIYNHDQTGREVFDPNISTAEISHGILTYSTVDSNDTFKYKNEFIETYEEALKIIQNMLH